MSQSSYQNWDSISQPYPYIDGFPDSIVDKANTNFYEPWVNNKVAVDVLDAQARVELKLLMDKNPGKTVSWPKNNAVIGIVYPR